jgi:hypothetical protein
MRPANDQVAASIYGVIGVALNLKVARIAAFGTALVSLCVAAVPAPLRT